MSRRSERRERRQQKRNEKKEQYKKYDDFENIISYQSLYNAMYAASKGVTWKQSVQRYLVTILFKIYKIRKDILEGKDIRKGFIEFDLNERGKTRHIKSVRFIERIVQKSICTNVLYPVISKSLILDNTASQKNKGTTFAIQRLTRHLCKFYRKHGSNGYVLLIDFKSYFENIEHKPLKELARKYFKDERIIKMHNDFVDSCGEKGLGLGSETSQINAITYVNKIDHYIKEVARIKYYGRYMDDSYLIHESKEYLENLLILLKEKFAQLGIRLNEKKTVIKELKHGFKFLKTRFYISKTGKIIRKPCRKSITVERRKLKKQAKLKAKGIISIRDILCSFESWRGSMKRRNSRKTVYSMTKLFNRLFKKEE